MTEAESKEFETPVQTLGDELDAIRDGKYQNQSGGYDYVVLMWARLHRPSLPVCVETIKTIDRGSTALVQTTWAFVFATVVLAVATVALVFVTRPSWAKD